MKEVDLWRKAIQIRKDALKDYPKGSDTYFTVKEAIEEMELKMRQIRRRHLFDVLKKK